MLRLRKTMTDLRTAGVWAGIWTLGYRKQSSNSSHSSRMVNEPAIKRLIFHRTRSCSIVFTTSTADLYCDSNDSIPLPPTIFILLIAMLSYSLHADVSINPTLTLSLLLYRASCRFTNYHTTNKCTNCMSFILKSLFLKHFSLLLHVSIAYRLSSSGSTYSS